MWFDSFADFIAMGGHGLYVWLAYGLAAVILGFNVISPLLKHKQFLREQARRLRREQNLTEQE